MLLELGLIQRCISRFGWRKRGGHASKTRFAGTRSALIEPRIEVNSVVTRSPRVLRNRCSQRRTRAARVAPSASER